MMSHSKKNKGFTLIELLVVMAMLAVLISFVSPYTVAVLESNQAKGEVIAMESAVKTWYSDAFFLGDNLNLSAKGSRLELQRGEDIIESRLFEYLFFPEQNIPVHSTVRQTSIEIAYQNRRKPFVLTVVIN